jgi:hypothetical protein
MKIRGADKLTAGELNFELQRGAKFVFFQWCISLLLVTFKRSSDVYFIRVEESAFTKGLPFTLLSLVAGWWGIPWGPIFTLQAVWNNTRGGKNVTADVLAELNKTPAPQTQPGPPAAATPIA